MNMYNEALAMKDPLTADRRHFHQNPELGLELPKTAAYVEEKLREMGYEPQRMGSGVVAVAGKKTGKCFLIRGDMDALPVTEMTDLEFKSENGCMHACGHDCHTANMLGAARLLKAHEDELEGQVKLMFQPAEETFEGSRNMIEHGILENPKVDAALAFHVAAGKVPAGLVMYNDSGVMMSSVDGFQITIHGKGAHGASPHTAIDPINVGAHIYLALQELIARESNPSHACVLTIGQFAAGSAPNIIPEVAVLQGTIRTNDKGARELLVRRMKQVAEGEAAVFGASVEIEMLSEVCPLICDPALTDEMVGYIRELPVPGLSLYPGASANASEDFALIAERVPSVFMYLGSGYLDERGNYGAHNPKVVFDEAVCPIGVAGLVHCAVQWLKKH